MGDNILRSYKSIWSSKGGGLRHNLSIYDERIKCYDTLSKIQQNLKNADEEYVRVSTIEGTNHKNALKRIEILTTEYRKEYELCEKIMKY
jgi:DNA anti-recombination protein RmuC